MFEAIDAIDTIDSRYFLDRAAQARGMALRAMTPAARNIHLELAADYEQRSSAIAPIPIAPGRPA